MRVLVVDDERPARVRMKRLLAEHDDVTCVGEASNGIEALERIAELAPDLVLLDVQMPELDGLEVAASLGSTGPAVVFSTAHETHALKAFELAAVDYLLKPVDKVRLAAALQRVRDRSAARGSEAARAVLGKVARRPSKMAVRVGTKYVVFDVEQIAAVLAVDHYAGIWVDGRELLSDESLDKIMERLDPETFVRVHRSAIVNLSFIGTLEQEGDRKFVAVLQDATKLRVPISRDNLEHVKSRLGIS